MSGEPAMSSSRPYMLRAMYQWIVDNDRTPYLLVDAAHPGVEVPPQAVKDGRIVLNLAPQAISGLDMGNEDVVFLTRFSGASMRLRLPVAAVQAVYAQETGQGMMFQDEDGALANDSGQSEAQSPAAVHESASDDQDKADAPVSAEPDKPARGAPHLRVIK